jgi:hypothetical protein
MSLCACFLPKSVHSPALPRPSSAANTVKSLECPAKSDPTFAQSLAQVLVLAHQRHLLLTAALPYSHSQYHCLRSRGVALSRYRTTQADQLATNTVTGGSPSAAKSINHTPSHASISAKHISPSSPESPAQTPSAPAPPKRSALRQLLA